MKSFKRKNDKRKCAMKTFKSLIKEQLFLLKIFI